jgi:hypothetical protein
MKTLFKLTLFFFIFTLIFLSAALTVWFIQYQELLILKKQLKANQTTVSQNGGTLKATGDKIGTIPVSSGAETLINSESTDASQVPQNPLTQITHKITGTIKKEKSPVEMDLGEYWLWIYMEEPLLVEDNAQGRPMNFDKIQITSPVPELLNLENFLDKKVEVSGNIGWGYAESNVFNAISIVFVN